MIQWYDLWLLNKHTITTAHRVKVFRSLVPYSVHSTPSREYARFERTDLVAHSLSVTPQPDNTDKCSSIQLYQKILLRTTLSAYGAYILRKAPLLSNSHPYPEHWVLCTFYRAPYVKTVISGLPVNPECRPVHQPPPHIIDAGGPKFPIASRLALCSFSWSVDVLCNKTTLFLG